MIFAIVTLGLVYLVFTLAGSTKIIEWSKSIGFFAFGLAIWVGMIVKLSDAAKSDFLPEWEQAAFNLSVSRLRAQIWGCFFFMVISSTVGVCAGIFAGTPYQDAVAVLTLYLTLSALGTLLFIPVFWGRITAALQYLSSRENEEKLRATEVDTLVKALQTPINLSGKFKGYSEPAQPLD